MKEYHVLSHTHWDREWYQPFEEFRLRLVDLLDNLLEIFEREPDYIFHLDAQAIALEDYLEIRPHKRVQLEELVRDKRLLVGPWYVQNDFYLTSGEATVRNLIIGSQIAESFGFCSKTGYVPDQFGLIGQPAFTGRHSSLGKYNVLKIEWLSQGVVSLVQWFGRGVRRKECS